MSKVNLSVTKSPRPSPVCRSTWKSSSSTSTPASPSPAYMPISGSKSGPCPCAPLCHSPFNSSCNSTGVYAGVVANGNGNENDTSNINATFLRGIQKSDSDGVAGWRTIFPGYYSGRATHIHMITHTNVTLLANDTISGGTIRHIGQVFYDQDLIDYINDNVYPYTTNTITLTDNDEDRVFITEADDDSDPVLNYVLLGEKVEDGLFAWITIGVDPDAEYTTSAASVLTDDGGYSTGNTEVV